MSSKSILLRFQFQIDGSNCKELTDGNKTFIGAKSIDGRTAVIEKQDGKIIGFCVKFFNGLFDAAIEKPISYFLENYKLLNE